MNIKNLYVISFLKYFLIGIAPFLVLILLELFYLNNIESFKTTVTQGLTISVISGLFGCLINRLRFNKIAYRLSLVIFVIMFSLVVIYVAWAFLLELKYPYFSEI